MQNDSRTLLSNFPNTTKFPSNHRKSVTSLTRLSRIKDKRTVFPQSTLNKIVFVSKMDGNGFQRENFYAYDIPGQFDMEQMINSINKVCYERWRKTFDAIKQEPFQKWFFAQKIVGALIFAIFALFIYLLLTLRTQYLDLIVYAFVALVFIGCLSSLIIIKQKRIQINKDAQMIYVIKRELARLNQDQLIHYENSRFTWTCHRQCLWIACEFH